MPTNPMCAIVILDSECAHQPGHFELLESRIGPSAHISPLGYATLSAFYAKYTVGWRGGGSMGGLGINGPLIVDLPALLSLS